MQEFNEVLVMVDLEYLGKDEPNAQILDIGICYGTSPDNLQRLVYKPAWQTEGVVHPSTLKFWAMLNPTKLAQYMDNKTPMQWVAINLYHQLREISREASLQGKSVVIMSKGITHDLPKLEYHIEREIYPSPTEAGFSVFETLFGYNCRRDVRSFKMYRSEKDLSEAGAYGEMQANLLCAGETLHDAEWDAVSQWCEVYRLAFGPSAVNTPTHTV